MGPCVLIYLTSAFMRGYLTFFSYELTSRSTDLCHWLTAMERCMPNLISSLLNLRLCLHPRPRLRFRLLPRLRPRFRPRVYPLPTSVRMTAQVRSLRRKKAHASHVLRCLKPRTNGIGIPQRRRKKFIPVYAGVAARQGHAILLCCSCAFQNSCSYGGTTSVGCMDRYLISPSSKRSRRSR